MKQIISGRLFTCVLLMALGCFAARASGETIRGKVITPEGEAAPGAVVKLIYCHDRTGFGSRELAESTADQDGRFVIEKPEYEPPAVFLSTGPETVRRECLAAFKDGYAFGYAAIFEGLEDGYVVPLQEGRRLRVRVVSANMTPVPGATVYIRRQMAPFSGLYLEPRAQWWHNALSAMVTRVQTDEQGLALYDFAPFRSMALRAFHPEAGEGLVSINAPCEETVLMLNRPVQRVRGVVKDAATGKPVEGMVLTTSGYAPGFWCVSGADGSFSLLAQVPTENEGDQSVGLKSFITINDTAHVARYPCHLAVWGWSSFSEIELFPGRLMTGRVINRGTGEPIPNAVLEACSVGGWLVGTSPINETRMADEEGVYHIRWPYESFYLNPACGATTAEMLIEEERKAPEGATYTVGKSGQGRKYTLPDSERNVDYEIAFDSYPHTSFHLRVTLPDGTPAVGARVGAWQEFKGAWYGLHGAYGVTDVDGHVRLAGLSSGWIPYVYVQSRDERFAQVARFPVLQKGDNKHRAIQLAPARKGEIVLSDSTGTMLPGRVSVFVQGRDPQQRYQIMSRTRSLKEEGSIFHVNGMASSMEYGVSASVSGFRSPSNMIDWNLPETAVTARLTIPMKPDPMWRSELVKGAEARRIAQEIAALPEVLWREKDPVDVDLEWVALSGGLILVDWKINNVSRFEAIAGQEGFRPNAIAFGEGSVWLATDAGLMVWHRKLRFWRRVAIGDEPAGSDVQEVSFEEGVLEATVRATDGTLSGFASDSSGVTWHPCEE